MSSALASRATAPVDNAPRAFATSDACVIASLVLASLLACVATPVMADEPGDLIIERDVTPRIAYRPVPVKDDPVAVRVTTFPSSTFDPMMKDVASDLDLSGARGSSGVQGNGSTSALAAAMSSLGVGQSAQQRNGAPLGAGASGGVTGVGATISQTITGAMAPLTTGLGTLK